MTKIKGIPLMLAAMCVVVLGSWVASLYGVGEVQSLLSAEGLRHEMRCALPEYMACPELELWLVMLPGVGLLVRSDALRVTGRLLRGKSLLRRERRSINWALAVAAVYVLLVVASVVGPWAVLRGVTGDLWPSPFADALPLILSVGLALVGGVYGNASGRCRGYAPIRHAFEQPYRLLAGYPVALFFVVRLFGQLAYTRLPEAVGLAPGLVTALFHLLAVALFVCEVRRAGTFRKNEEDNSVKSEKNT